MKLPGCVGEIKGQTGGGNNVQGKNLGGILEISPSSGTCKGSEITKAAAKA